MMKNILIIVLFIFASGLVAQSTKESTIYTTKDGAIKGYDPVAYFVESKPVKGNKSISYNWQGSSWYFSSQANLDLFKENPEKYAPQYGGYCAYGWAQGYAVKIEPEAWSIVNGKLYLNYSSGVQKDWDKDRTGFIKKADENYAKRN